jgi:predicted membrane metal-binding protein
MGIGIDEGTKSSVTERARKGAKISENRLVKLAIVLVVFPIFVEVVHFLLSFPATFIAYWLVHFRGHPKFWGTTLSVAALIPACWGAYAVCKWIWPHSK